MDYVRLGDVCRVVSGSTPKSEVAEFWDGTIKWITPAELHDDTYIVTDTERHITKRAVEKTHLTLLPVGTVLLSSRAPIGKTAIVGAEMYCNQGFKNLICSDRIFNRYLYFFLTARTKYLNDLGRGATFKEISKTIVENIEIPLPELDGQKKIVARLEKIEALMANRKHVIAWLEKIVQARFVEMFGDPGTNPHNWNMVALECLGELNRGISKHRPRNDPDLLNGEYPLIQTGDVAATDLYIRQYGSTYSEMGLHQSRMWPKGTLCITIAANIAKTGILQFDACFPDSIVGFIPDKVSAIYIHFWFTFFQKILEEQAPQSAQKNINLKVLRALQVMCPPFPLQQKFAAFVRQTDAARHAAEAQLAALATLRAKVLQDAFGA